MADNCKKYNLLDPRDFEQVHKCLCEEEDDEEQDFDDEDDTEGEDEVKTCQNDSETEQEDEDGDESGAENEDNYFIGKDKETKWNKLPPSKRKCAKQSNLVQ